MRAHGAASGNRVARGSPARPPDHGVMSGGTIPRPTGAQRQVADRNFTSSRQTAGTQSPQNISLFWSSSTKLSAALSRIAIDNSAARNLRNAVTDRLTPYSQRGVQF